MFHRYWDNLLTLYLLLELLFSEPIQILWPISIFVEEYKRLGLFFKSFRFEIFCTFRIKIIFIEVYEIRGNKSFCLLHIIFGACYCTKLCLNVEAEIQILNCINLLLSCLSKHQNDIKCRIPYHKKVSNAGLSI